MDGCESVRKAVVESLCGPKPSSWWIRVPPGCGATEFLRSLEASLKNPALCPARRLAAARFSTDTLADDGAFLRKVEETWRSAGLPVPDRPTPGPRGPSELLEDTVKSLASQGYLPVLILDRFHKAAEVLSATMLSSLRELEDEHFLATVAGSPVGHKSLRERLRAEGLPFGTSSNYGDMHSNEFIGSITRDECGRLVREKGLDEGMLDGLIELTGGVPLLLLKAIHEVRRARGGRRLVLSLLREQVLDRFIEWLSPSAEGRGLVCARLAALFLGVESDEDVERLGEHEWSAMLVRDRRLVSQMVGLAALRYVETREVASWKVKATLLYERHAFGAADALLRSNDGAVESPVLVRAVRIMGQVSESLETLDIESDWSVVAKEASAGLADCRGHPSLKDTAEGFGRWLEVANCLSCLSRSIALDQQLDTLLSAQEPGQAARRVAIFLGIRMHAAKRHRSPTLSLLLASAVPESVLRAWARIRMGMDTSKPIDFKREPLCSGADRWFGRSFRPPQENVRASLVEISVAVCCRQEQELPRSDWFFDEAGIRERECKVVSRLRNPTSHTVVMGHAGIRDEILSVSERWLGRLAQVAGFDGVSGLYKFLEPIQIALRARGRWQE